MKSTGVWLGSFLSPWKERKELVFFYVHSLTEQLTCSEPHRDSSKSGFGYGAR